jgi:hypothetical protein
MTFRFRQVTGKHPLGLFLVLLFSSTLQAAGIPEYDRSDWDHWVDSDYDCQNTRHEILIRESLAPVTFEGGSQCRVTTGRWYGPYLGRFFTRSSDLDLDHVIPLKWAHGHGGWRWSSRQKQRFANDSQNLLLVDDGRNRSKGSKGPGKWMPDDPGFHCAYIIRWGYLIDKYQLVVDQMDQRRINGLTRGCILS